jgi:hypothetical protein
LMGKVFFCCKSLPYIRRRLSEWGNLSDVLTAVQLILPSFYLVGVRLVRVMSIKLCQKAARY